VIDSQVAQVLRKLALDEKMKWQIPADPTLGPLVGRIARRYVAGESLVDAVARAESSVHRVNVEYMGESCRDPDLAVAETDVFVNAAKKLPEGCSVSLDLSHIGLAIDHGLALRNAVRIAEATAETGREMVISAEGSDRADAILNVHEKLCESFGHVGITVQARLHRTGADFQRVLDRPGRIRLVKGAFLEPEAVAFPREAPELADAYLRYAEALADSGHLSSFATHDWDLIHHIDRYLGQPSKDSPWEFETLMGLGPDQLAAMAGRGHPTREYIVFGTEWWLYVCNRLAEDPQRLLQAVLDAAH
jgi:proline dehydrogenase